MLIIDHFKVLGLVSWPLTGREAEVDLFFLKQTSFLLLWKLCLNKTNIIYIHNKAGRVVSKQGQLQPRFRL